MLILGFARTSIPSTGFFLRLDVFVDFPETRFLRVFLTTEDEGFYLRERDLVVEAGEMSDQIDRNQEGARETGQYREFLFLTDQKRI